MMMPFLIPLYLGVNAGMAVIVNIEWICAVGGGLVVVVGRRMS